MMNRDMVKRGCSLSETNTPYQVTQYHVTHHHVTQYHVTRY